ncbi:MAG: hypothetical protein KA007_01150 [Candidatus Pacebacteria bacterium]|nr:hypothetical protein [Candidatus Paceibacterota bacterium]
MKIRNKFVLPEGVMEIEFDVHMWELLENGVLPKVEIVGLVELNVGTKASIRIQADTAIEFDTEQGKQMSKAYTINVSSGGDHHDEAIYRTMSVMMKYLLLETPHWFISGIVKSRNGRGDIPIFMVYSKIAKRAFYSIKRSTDTGEGGPSVNFSPRMN